MEGVQAKSFMVWSETGDGDAWHHYSKEEVIAAVWDWEEGDDPEVLVGLEIFHGIARPVRGESVMADVADIEDIFYTRLEDKVGEWADGFHFSPDARLELERLLEAWAQKHYPEVHECFEVHNATSYFITSADIQKAKANGVFD